MKRLICIICLLLIVSCQKQQDQGRWEYVVHQSKEGYAVKILGREHFTFDDDLRMALQDGQLSSHIIFWSTTCGYLFLTIPLTHPVDYLLIPSP